MARGQEIRYTLSGNSSGLTSAAASGAASLDKLGAAAAKSTSNAGKFSAAIAQTSTTMARSAAAFGLPIGPLRALDDVADIAAIGFGNLSRAAVGFNAATVGVIGAGFAVGYMLGGLIRQLPGVAAAADKAAEALQRLFTSQADLDRQALGNMSQKDWLANTGLAASGEAQRKKMLAGMSDAAKLRFLKGDAPLTENEKLIASIEKQMAASKKAAELAKKLGEEWVKGMEAARRATEEFNQRLAEGTLDAARGVQESLNTRAAARSEANVEDVLARTGILSTEAAGPPTEEIVKAVTATERWEKALNKTTDALWLGSRALEFLGFSADSFLAKAMGNIGQGMDLGGQIGGLFGKQGELIGKVIGGAVGAIKSLFGGGPSKEELAAQRAAEEKERARIGAAAKEMRGKGIDSLAAVGPQFFMQSTITDADSARRQGVLFAAAWGTVVREKGIVAAAAAFGEAFAKMKADIEAAGIEAPAWMKAIQGDMTLGLDPAFKAIAEAAFTAAEFLKAFAEAGGTLTPDVQKAFEQEARAAFGGGKQAALDLGQGEEEAVKAGFAAANPLLRGLLDQSIVQGVALSADIQAMIDAAGIVPGEIVQQLEELRAIRKAVEGLAGYPGAPIPGGGNGGNQGQGLPEFARGGDTDDWSPRGKGGNGGFPAILHPGELVLPKEDIPSFLKAHGAGSDSTGSMALGSMLRELKNQPPAITANITLNTDTSMMPRHSQQDFLDEQEKRIVRMAQPGGALHREILLAAESVVRKRSR